MINVAIVGATGVVGKMFLKVLEEKNLNIDNYVLFASKRSKGKKIKFMNKEHIVEELTENSFDNNRSNYALFSAGATTAEKYAMEVDCYFMAQKSETVRKKALRQKNRY